MTKLAALTEKLQTLADRGATEGERDAARRALTRIQARQQTTPDQPYRYKFEGEKYRDTSKLTALEIAAMIREDIKVARKAAKMAGMHEAELTTVDPIAALPKEARITVARKWSTYTAIIVITVRGLVGDRWWMFARGYEPEYGPRVEGNERRYFATDELTQAGLALQELANVYNFDNSDVMTDYFHQRFFLDVQAVPPGEKWPTDITHRRRVVEWIDEQPAA